MRRDHCKAASRGVPKAYDRPCVGRQGQRLQPIDCFSATGLRKALMNKVLKQILLIIVPAAFFGTVSFAQKPTPKPVTTVLLVHGAFADSSSWKKVIPILKSKGLRVVTVDIPLTSLAEDVAVTRKAISLQA